MKRGFDGTHPAEIGKRSASSEEKELTSLRDHAGNPPAIATRKDDVRRKPMGV